MAAITEALDGGLGFEDYERSLSGRWRGIALLHGYLERAWPSHGHRDRAAALRDDCVRTADSKIGVSLYGGVTGVAWMIAQLHSMDGEDDEPHPNAEIDEVLRDLLQSRAVAFVAQRTELGSWNAQILDTSSRPG